MLGDSSPFKDAAGQARDQELLRRMQNDDVGALSQLMDLHTPRLIYLAEITAGTFDLAREAVQDAFLRIWDKRQSLKSDTKIFNYLLVTTHNRVLDLLRHEKMHGRTKAEIARTYVDGNSHAYNQGELATEQEEAKIVLQKALAELQPRAREIYLLHHEAGLSYEEIAQVLAISYGTVKLQMSKAGTSIGKALKKWMAGS